MAHDPQTLAERCVQRMLAGDAFTAWLGAELLEVAPGRCRLAMVVRQEMTNGFGTCHGGVTFAFADSALAFACNSYGKVTVALDLSISYPAAAQVGDRLIAQAEERSRGGRIGFYDVTVSNQDGEIVALFRATAYATQQEHLSDE